MIFDDLLNLMQRGLGQIAGDGVLHRRGCITILHSLLDITIRRDQPIQRTGNIRIAGANPVYDIDIFIRRLFKVLIRLCIIGNRTEVMPLRTMYRPLRGKDCLDWIILREAFDHFAAGTSLQEGQLRSRLGAEEYIDIRKNRENRLPRLIPGPEITAEIDIEGNQCTGFLKPSDGFNGCLPKLRRKCQRDAGGMEAFGALKYLRIDILHPEGEKLEFRRS